MVIAIEGADIPFCRGTRQAAPLLAKRHAISVCEAREGDSKKRGNVEEFMVLDYLPICLSTYLASGERLCGVTDGPKTVCLEHCFPTESEH